MGAVQPKDEETATGGMKWPGPRPGASRKRSRVISRTQDVNVSGTPEKLIDVPALAELTGMTTGYVYAAVRRGEIPAIRLGRSVRFRPSAIRAWCESIESRDEESLDEESLDE